MKNITKKPLNKSKTPPKGYPTESEWVDIEKDLGKSLPSKMLSANASPVDRTKQEICAHFIKYRIATNITQRELAKRLDVTESRVSELLHYHFERFTIDKLLELLNKIKPDVRLKVA